MSPYGAIFVMWRRARQLLVMRVRFEDLEYIYEDVLIRRNTEGVQIL